MSRISLLPIAMGISLALAHPGLSAGGTRDYEMETLSRRLFPTLSAIDALAPLAGQDDRAGLTALIEQRQRRRLACAEVPACVVEAAEWKPAEMEALARVIEHAARSGRSIPAPSPDGIRAQVLRELRGLNSILAVYGLGEAPRYPLIDGPGAAAGSPESDMRIATAVEISETVAQAQDLTADHSVDLATALLDVNGRDDPVRFEPLDPRFNRAALARARGLDWSRYPYTAIIVPGEGPEDPATPLSAPGKLRVRLAAKAYFDHLAPFVILTGGGVHPKATRYVEALQMREALMRRFGVPAAGIIVEPYARHTTTNLRNAARRLFALKAPAGRDALIVTDPAQSRYIEAARFKDRNQRELGYQPGAIGPRLSPTKLVFRPAAASITVDPLDPLDP